ncbi:TraB/GumN family protein [Erythrobacter sp. sf7]|uniref:TraB/GumN family protein n=1 Tax=Erythrobacter fulvus TaxID=2987523 RepID=A0ABT5JL06_9SPHN|nr:TraB/GumN family protein [Erythrobacter fulvus]MDC8753249.1 TraB/GumN family protein [Erythrobacter fulvus]
MWRAVAAALVPALALYLAGCSDAPGEDTEGPPPNPLLYEIAGADGTVEGWMLGTIHALPPGTRWQTPPIDRATEMADILVVEIAALDDRPALSRIYAELATTPGLPPLDKRLPAALRPQLADLLARGDMDANAFTETESWAAALMLAQVDAVGDPEYGVDRALIRAFPANRVRELEGARGQLEIFDALPEAEQRDLIAAVVTEGSEARARADELRRAWLSGDEAALTEAATRGIMADPELRETLLVARNRRWDGRIAALLEQPERPLIAVGTAHLLGPDGLVAMLEARGYRVTRLP